MYKDHIVKTRATDNVAFMGTIAVVIFVVALFSGVGEGSLARLMGPIVLDLQAPCCAISPWRPPSRPRWS